MTTRPQDGCARAWQGHPARATSSQPDLAAGAFPGICFLFPPVYRTFLKTKLHRATITAADPEYEGSVTVDRELCKAARLQEFEQVDVLDINNGARFTTYVIYGGPGEIQVNGAAARLVTPGDLAIIIAYCRLPEDKVASHKPRVVLLGPGNKITGEHEHEMREP